MNNHSPKNTEIQGDRTRREIINELYEIFREQNRPVSKTEFKECINAPGTESNIPPEKREAAMMEVINSPLFSTLKKELARGFEKHAPGLFKEIQQLDNINFFMRLRLLGKDGIQLLTDYSRNASEAEELIQEEEFLHSPYANLIIKSFCNGNTNVDRDISHKRQKLVNKPDLETAPVNKKKSAFVYYQFKESEDSITYSQALDGFTLGVNRAISSIYDAGYEFFTVDHVYRAMHGWTDSNHNTPPKIRQRIKASIEKLRNVHCYIDATDQIQYNRAAKDAGLKKLVFDDKLLSVRCTMMILFGQSEAVEAYSFNAPPLLYAYAKAIGQIQRFPNEWLIIRKSDKDGLATGEQMRMSEQRIAIRDEVLSRIYGAIHGQETLDGKKAIASHLKEDSARRKQADKKIALIEKEQDTKKERIRFDTLYALHGEKVDKKQQQRIREFVYAVLDTVKRRGDMKEYSTYSDSKTALAGVKLEF